MADVTSGITIREESPRGETKTLVVATANTVDDGDTLDVTLADHGMSTVLAVEGYDHTTEDSVIVAQAPTTAVASGVLTITVGGATDNLKRVFVIHGY